MTFDYLILWRGLDLLILGIAKVYVFRSLGSMLGKPRISTALYNILCAILVVASMLNKSSDKNILLLSILGISGLWLVLKISYDASAVQRWIVLVGWIALIIIAETSVQSIIWGILYLGSVTDPMAMKIVESIGMLFMVLALKGQINIYKRLDTCVTNDRWAAAITLIPLMINSVSIVMIFYYISKNNAHIEFFIGTLISVIVGVALANIASIISASTIAGFYEAEIENREALTHSESEFEYYSRLEEEQERIRLLYHDINNHIACIKEVAKEQKELTQYINALEKEVQATRQSYKTGCTVVDAILRQKSIICDKKQISLSVNLNLSACNFIRDMDLCSIFANALDNAIEACDRIKNNEIKKYIYMESQVIRGFLVIKIKNSKEHTNKWDNNSLVTQKKDKKLHGLGLKNIKRALDKYEGEYIIKEEINEFYLKLVIPMQKQDVVKTMKISI